MNRQEYELKDRQKHNRIRAKNILHTLMLP